MANTATGFQSNAAMNAASINKPTAIAVGISRPATPGRAGTLR
jgi:hypothetical protein